VDTAKSRSRRIGLALIVSLGMFLGIPQGLPARVKPSSGFNLFSAQEEIQAGQQAAADATKQLPVLPDSDPVVMYVQQLGARLAAHAPGEKWPYNFHVINQKEINAFALPGGPIYVNLGTIQAADNEAELAGVMAHEISHVVQRHGTRAATKQMAAQLPLAILGGIMGRGALSQMAQLGISFGVGSYFLKNSRSAESEADLLGADIMHDAGYDPRAMAEFFAKLEKEGGGAHGPQFLSDHPNPGNRAQAVSREANTLPRKQYQTTSADFSRVKQLVAGMKPLTAQEISAMHKGGMGPGGTVPGGGIAMPSGSFQKLEHNDYSISYPDNWQVYGDKSSAVTIAPQNGVSENAIAYGVMISVYQPEAANTPLDRATHEFVNSLHQSNPDLKQIGNDENMKVNGVAAKSVELIGTSPVHDSQGQVVRERDWLVTVQKRDGSLLYMVFISPEPEFASLRPVFEQMVRSMRMR